MTENQTVSICFDGIFESITKKSEEYAKAHADNADYTDPNDNLIHCGKCHTPKQCRIRNLKTGGSMIVNCVCRCDAEKSDEEKIRKEQQLLLERKTASKIPISFIEYRISTGKPMIITTNLELEEMKSATDIRKIRTYDRLFRVCFPIPFHGVSFRKKHARDNFETMNELLNA